MSTRKRISKILSILLIASMVLTYNSSIAFTVWAATDDATEVSEETQAGELSNEDAMQPEGEES